MKKRYPFQRKNCFPFGAILTFGLFLSVTASAQLSSAKQWEGCFGGNSSDNLFSVQQTADGGYILGGSSFSETNGNKTAASKGNMDYWIVRLDSHGQKLWDKSFGGSNGDLLRVARQTSDGGFILGGWSISPVSGDRTQASFGSTDFWLVKTDANGALVWEKTIGGTGNDDFTDLQQTADGGYILGGSSDSPISGDKTENYLRQGGYKDYWIVKLDANGKVVWDKTIGGIYNEHLSSVRQTADGGYILGGSSDSPVNLHKSQPSFGSNDYWVVKLDAAGNQQWDKTLGGNETDNFSCIRQTMDGGYIMGGSSYSGKGGEKTQAGHGKDDYWIVKLDKNGQKQWDRTYGGLADDGLYDLQQTTDGGYILGGISKSPKSGNKSQASLGGYDYWVLRLDSGGNLLWDKTFGSQQDDLLLSLQQTSDRGFILGGFSDGSTSGDKSCPSFGAPDFWIIKLEPEKGLEAFTFPNPTSGEFKLQLSNPTAPTAEVVIYNHGGSKVLHQQFEVTNSQIVADLQLPKGLYLVRVRNGSQTAFTKLVVL